MQCQLLGPQFSQQPREVEAGVHRFTGPAETVMGTAGQWSREFLDLQDQSRSGGGRGEERQRSWERLQSQAAPSPKGMLMCLLFKFI